MKGAHFLVYIFILVYFTACQNQESGFDFASKQSTEAYSTEAALYEESDEYTEAEASNAVPSTQDFSDTVQRKLIKTANIRFQVKDLENTKTLIEKIVEAENAIIVTSNLQNNSYQLAYQLTIRVASRKFTNLVEAISQKAEVLDTKEITAKDVTEEFVDVTARLKAKKQVENRYLEILKQASSVADVLEVEKKLGEIREEIEATEGRLRFLKNQVALSTIHLYVYQLLDEQKDQLQPSFLSRIGKGLGNGWELFLDFIVSLSYSWPFIILISLSLFFMRKWIVKKKSKKEGTHIKE